MKLSCLQENLARGLSVVGRAVASRSTLPITQYVMLSCDQGMLRLSATNLEIAITTWIGAMIEEEGAITVPHRLVSDLVNSLPSDRVDLDLRGPDPDDPTPVGVASCTFPAVVPAPTLMALPPTIFRQSPRSIPASRPT